MKEHLKETVSSFFISAALINAAMFILGILFRPEQRFGYDAFLYPLIYAAISCIPQLVMYSEKELSLRQLIIRKIITLGMIIIMLLILISGGGGFDTAATVGITVSIIIIYIAVHIIQWYLDSKTARQLTEELKEFQKRADNAV